HFLPSHACGELLAARREILGDEVEDLRTHMPAAASPAGSGVCRFDRIADIFAIPFRDFAEDTAVRADDLAGVALVWPGLLAADEELVGAIYRREGLGPRAWGPGSLSRDRGG